MWITCATVDEAAAALEALYPPSETIGELLELDGAHVDSRPPQQYALTAFRREYVDKEDARQRTQQAKQAALAAGLPYYSTRV